MMGNHTELIPNPTFDFFAPPPPLYTGLYPILGGYDSTQLRISGQYSYDKTAQRDIQFFTDIRELDRDTRTWQGEESRSQVY